MGYLVNLFLMVYPKKFRVLIFSPQNRVRLRFNFRPSKQSSFYVFGVFVDRGGDLL